MAFSFPLALCCVTSVGLVVAAPATFGPHAAQTSGAESTNATTPVNHMTLDAVVSDVLEHNPELSFYNAEVGAAKGGSRTAAAWINPEIASAVGDKRVTGGGAPAGEGVTWAVSVRQTFEWPGRIPLRKAIANLQIRLAELGLNQFRAALMARTRSAAFGLLSAQQKAAAAREVADRFHALRQVLVQRDPAGITPQLELRIIEATEITMLRKASEASVAEQAAMFELNQLRGQPWQQSITIVPEELGFAAPLELEGLLASARENNFEIRMRQAELEQQGFKVSLARNERYPSFSVAPYVFQERARDTEQQFGVQVSVPLPLWNRNEGNIETALSRQRQAETSMYVTQRNIERQVVEKAMTYQTKINEMGKWRAESIEELRKAGALADRHYRLGAVAMVTYVELQKQYLEALESLLETRREALDAVQQLEVLTGLEITPGNPTRPNSRGGSSKSPRP